MSGSDAIVRRAARVIVVDAMGRVLMLRGCDPARPDHRYWMTVGGGLEHGESVTEAAARELGEETGVRLAAQDFGAPVWHDVTEFPFDGRWYRQEQDYFLVRVPSCEVDLSGFNEIERATVDAHRWWERADFTAATEPYYPRELPDLLNRLLGPEAA
jgi:8-oxo-dGTP pyrophosphatase MutT (NUDIX family)